MITSVTVTRIQLTADTAVRSNSMRIWLDEWKRPSPLLIGFKVQCYMSSVYKALSICVSFGSCSAFKVSKFNVICRLIKHYQFVSLLDPVRLLTNTAWCARYRKIVSCKISNWTWVISYVEHFFVLTNYSEIVKYCVAIKMFM